MSVGEGLRKGGARWGSGWWGNRESTRLLPLSSLDLADQGAGGRIRAGNRPCAVSCTGEAKEDRTDAGPGVDGRKPPDGRGRTVFDASTGARTESTRRKPSEPSERVNNPTLERLQTATNGNSQSTGYDGVLGGSTRFPRRRGNRHRELERCMMEAVSKDGLLRLINPVSTSSSSSAPVQPR